MGVIARRRRFLMVLALIGTTPLSGCYREVLPTQEDDTVEHLSEHYQGHGDYESLTLLMPQLNVLDMRRSQVIALLGEPHLCPTASVCYYGSDESVPAACGEGLEQRDGVCYGASGQEVPPLSFVVTLVVRYDGSAGLADPSDRLVSFCLGPVGE